MLSGMLSGCHAHAFNHAEKKTGTQASVHSIVKLGTPRSLSDLLSNLAYNNPPWHMLNAAIIFGSHIENISIKTAARVLVTNKTAILMSQQLNRPALFAALYEQMISVPVGNRLGRSEPRAVKKKPKPYPRLQGRRNE